MEFIKKNKVVFIVATLIILFVVSIALTPTPTEYVIEDASLSEWIAATNEDKYTIVTLAQTTCGACTAFKPSVQKFAETYDVEWYWFEVNLMEQSEFDKLGEMFPDFQGTPYTAVMKNGKVTGKINGAADYSSIAPAIKQAGIELVERPKEEK